MNTPRAFAWPGGESGKPRGWNESSPSKRPYINQQHTNRQKVNSACPAIYSIVVAVHDHWNTCKKLNAARGWGNYSGCPQQKEGHQMPIIKKCRWTPPLLLLLLVLLLYYRINLPYTEYIGVVHVCMYGYGPKHQQREQCKMKTTDTSVFEHRHVRAPTPLMIPTIYISECFRLRVIQASDSNKPLRNYHVVAYLPTIFILRHPTRPYPSRPEYVV